MGLVQGTNVLILNSKIKVLPRSQKSVEYCARHQGGRDSFLRLAYSQQRVGNAATSWHVVYPFDAHKPILRKLVQVATSGDGNNKFSKQVGSLVGGESGFTEIVALV
jgi:hypothetical protein